MSPFSLQGKTILITGASSGIGRACAVCASRLGASIIATGRRDTALQETISNCEGAGHQIEVGDIADPEFVKKLVEKSGKIDGLVHAAGIGPACPVGALTMEHVEEVMKTNYYSFLELMKYCTRNKYRKEKLSVVAISSVAGLVGWRGVAVYGGSKGALSSSVRAMAIEFAAKGIRVNAVCPSNIRTPMLDEVLIENGDEAAKDEILRRQPLGLGEPDQVAWPVCFLLSDAAGFITGVNLPVDGGYLAQ